MKKQSNHTIHTQMILKEYELILQKKSKLSRTQRDKIVKEVEK